MHKIVLAITGASGSIYPKLLLEKLLTIGKQWEELGVVMTENAKQVWETELGNADYKDLMDFADKAVTGNGKRRIKFYSTMDFNAPFASGSGRYNTVIIAPCSMGTLGRIATGVSTDLITRAADVVLKERRKLICMIRDTPYNLIHIRNMETVTLAGGIICPASPSFYSKPTTIEAVAATVADRVLDLAGLDISTYRWGKKNSCELGNTSYEPRAASHERFCFAND
ncbi:UbiX family flavin prenyltransferase [Paraflavitalea speifideaquila]|uniref:UbiX family flavin prenyltransferase n=1 Tax=Paraflavitalea speifideaquila TaxID=3076558 RepID=UPI0028F14CD8|nr:UbiX family flavin prenyltransferase [Paraflavitalea speifideiaquila]